MTRGRVVHPRLNASEHATDAVSVQGDANE
jgi:hypothetical protein